MVKRNGLIITSILVLLLLSLATVGPVVTADETTTAAEDRVKLFSFQSYIDITYDDSKLNQNLQVDQAINVPIKIKYSTNVPANFLQFLPWQIKNIILYGSMIGPMQQITLEILDKPDWADINLAKNDILSNIPNVDEIIEEETSLILSPYEEAPAQPYSIKIKASCEQIGRINKYSTEITISFTPSFVPTVTIVPENPTRTVGPRESVNFEISVKNEANKKARITPKIISNASEWSPTINPPFFDISAGAEEAFTFSVYSPYDFGWHNEIQTFQIDITTQIFPINDNSAVGGPYSIYLRLNNYGFSTPGFELIPIIVALGLALIMVRKKHLDRK